MRHSITAIVLSKDEYSQPQQVDELLVVRQIIKTPFDLQRARFNAVSQVQTTHFFYLDDDDTLPDDVYDIAQDCANQYTAVAYTDELIQHEDGSSMLWKSEEYSYARHMRNSRLIHHLALCDTEVVKRVLPTLPRGNYCPEYMLYLSLGRIGAKYVPRVGYVWNRKKSGMSTWPATAASQANAFMWAKAKWGLE